MTGSHQARVASHHNSAPRRLPGPWAAWVTPLEGEPGRFAPTAVHAALVSGSGLLNVVLAVSDRQLLARRQRRQPPPFVMPTQPMETIHAHKHQAPRLRVEPPSVVPALIVCLSCPLVLLYHAHWQSPAPHLASLLEDLEVRKVAAFHPAAVAVCLAARWGEGRSVQQHLAALLVVQLVAVAGLLYSLVVVPRGEPLEVQPKAARYCSQ